MGTPRRRRRRSDKTQQVATKAHGSQAPPAPPSDETIQTTAKHPWLTTDRGWVRAGALRVGEQVVALGGRTTTITALTVRPGAATYYNLTVSQLHTYAVGKSRAVVHNANGPCLGDSLPDYAGGKTEGILDRGTGPTGATRLISGEWGASRDMHYNEPEVPVIGKDSHSPLWSHVEGQAAAIMRDEGLDEDTLWINNAPCSTALGTGCSEFLPHMLPEGAQLTVNVKVSGGGGWLTSKYVGLPDSAWPPANWPPRP
jgi:nucleic acid/nucleotide deaminase of polymorphic system toxin/pretoxin HINT domain-containing protein